MQPKLKKNWDGNLHLQFEEGLEKTVEWYLQTRNGLSILLQVHTRNIIQHNTYTGNFKSLFMHFHSNRHSRAD